MRDFKKAWIHSLPILCSYIFISMAYGMTMSAAGLKWPISLLASFTIYTGAFQFLLITLLSSGASLVTIGLMALLMNSRQAFYSLSFLDVFRKMGKKRFYMIPTMTDETYAINCQLLANEPHREQVMFWLALLSRSYWLIGTLIGSILGQVLPFQLEGIDFSMTALFVIIFIDQWEAATDHLPALLGLGIAVISLLVIGKNGFILPALMIVSALLVLLKKEEVEKA